MQVWRVLRTPCSRQCSRPRLQRGCQGASPRRWADDEAQPSISRGARTMTVGKVFSTHHPAWRYVRSGCLAAVLAASFICRLHTPCHTYTPTYIPCRSCTPMSNTCTEALLYAYTYEYTYAVPYRTHQRTPTHTVAHVCMCRCKPSRWCAACCIPKAHGPANDARGRTNTWHLQFG